MSKLQSLQATFDAQQPDEYYQKVEAEITIDDIYQYILAGCDLSAETEEKIILLRPRLPKMMQTYNRRSSTHCETMAMYIVSEYTTLYHIFGEEGINEINHIMLQSQELIHHVKCFIEKNKKDLL